MESLQQIIADGIPHFIAKYYVTAEMECDQFITKYEVYFRGDGKGRWSPSCETHHGLQYLDLNKKEIRWIHDNMGRLYVKELSNSDGEIYVHKELGFSKLGIRKKQAMTLDQLKLFKQ